MALSNTTNRYETGTLNGIGVGYTVATWSSRISAESDLKVYVVESDGTTTLLALDVDYEIDPTLSGTLITSCNIKAKKAEKFPDGSSVIVIRETDFLQASDYATNGVILSDTLENDLDKLAMQTQQLKDDITRSVRFSASLLESEIPDPEISFDATARSNKVLGFDASGDFAVTQELGTFVGDWTDGTDYQTRDIVRTWGQETDDNYGSLWIAKQSHTADDASGISPSNSAPLASNDYWELILDTGHFATQADVAATNANTSESKATEAQDWANKTNGDVVVDEVASGEYSAKAYAIGGTGVTGAAGPAKDWAIKTDGTVDGTNYSAKHWADNSESSASNASTSATNAATSESNAATSETNAATSATAAAGSASSASTSATNAASSATSASTSASNAATSETNAATSETNAASSASAASTSETNAATSATAASTSASNAATSATAAANSATAAGTAQTAAETAQGLAETAQAAAETAYDNFDDRYLGSKTSAPSVDNDGNALLVGALYFDSTAGALRVWDGSAWNSVEALPQPLATTDSPTFAGLDVTANSASEAAVITQSGAGDALRITQTGTGNALVVEDSSPDSTPFVVDGTGKVRIGTDTSTAYQLFSDGNTNHAAGFVVLGEEYDPNSQSSRGNIFVPAGTVVSVTAKDNSVNSGSLINFTAYNSSSVSTGAFIGAAAGSTGNGPAHLVFGRRTGATSWAESMRIDSSGNVRADKFTDLAGTGAPDFPNGLTYNSEGFLGHDQTWQDFTSSRTSGVTYTNTTGKPIFIIIGVQDGSSSTVSIDSLANLTHTTLTMQRSIVSFIVPNNSTYVVTFTVKNFLKWLELR